MAKSPKQIKIGIECESIEDGYGVGKLTLNLLKEYANNLEWQTKYKLYLYFKGRVLDHEFLKDPIFIKRPMHSRSFNLFYHILLPIRATFDRLDWMFFPNYMLPPLYTRRSIVMLTDDLYYEYTKGTIPLKYKLAYRLFSNWAAKKATKILAISETSKKEISRLFKIKPEKIFVSYLGIDQKDENPQLKKENYILYVGQMFPRRHAKESILAFEKMAGEFPDLKLVLIGKDKYNPPIIDNLIKNKNRITHYNYIGSNEEMKSWFKNAKLVLYISENEAFGLPPLEALAFGVPPIIMNNELGHELFGEHAFYSKSGEVNDIANAIKQALSDRQKIDKIKSGGAEFVKKYNWKDFAKSFFENVKN